MEADTIGQSEESKIPDNSLLFPYIKYRFG
jgi:hypothetical protein